MKFRNSVLTHSINRFHCTFPTLTGMVRNMRLPLLLALVLFAITIPSLTVHVGASTGGGSSVKTPVPAASPQSQADQQGQAPEAKFRRSQAPARDRYIVVLKDDTPDKEIAPVTNELATSHGGNVDRIYKYAIKGFSAQMPEAAALALSQDPRVEFVEEDSLGSVASSQWVSTWGWNLSRIDQRDYPSNYQNDLYYNYGGTGAGVHVYILDTGIRSSHQEFGGRATRDYDVYGGNGDDCFGHGTHVAGIIGGSTHGVAKSVRLHGIKVGARDENGNVGCAGGRAYDSDVIAGFDWVTAHRIRPAVANLSYSGSPSSSVDLAVRRCISAGVTVVVAAGNENVDASTESPARVEEAITVSATNSSDRRGSQPFGDFFANFGAAVDLFAPGVSIESTWFTSDTDTHYETGTSMAAPHVAGVAAQFLQANPAADPDAAQGAIKNFATRDHVIEPGEGTPNRLLYSSISAALVRETSVTVRESDHDVDTGIDINPGEWATISTTGQIWAGWWFTASNDPEGWDSIANNPNYPLPSARQYCLLGKLGSGYFYVGRSNNTMADLTQTQRLFLRINDDVPGNGNGAFTCRIQVWKKRPSASIFISQYMPVSMTPGQTVSVGVTMLNTGDTTWSAGDNFSLGSQNPQDNFTWGRNRAPLPQSVPPGSQVTIPFTITAPTTPGNYNFRWRMVQDGVEWFGDLTDNVLIPVNYNTYQAQFVSQTVKSVMYAGEFYNVSITVKNIGSTLWPGGTTIKLGSQNPQDNTTWGINRVVLPNAVFPGSQYTFNFTVTAPGRIGNYNFQWRMLEEGIQWFGDYTPNVVVQVKYPPCLTC